jgi:hypothetical protein
MCLIIDNDVVHEVFKADSSSRFVYIKEGLFEQKKPLKLVYGGRLRDEYFESETIRRIILQLDRAGRAVAMPDEAIKAVELSVEGLCESNDAHVIALAVVSNARILLSSDKTLHQDFTNPDLVKKPRGKVYQGVEHARLLSRSDSCKIPRI